MEWNFTLCCRRPLTPDNFGGNAYAADNRSGRVGSELHVSSALATDGFLCLRRFGCDRERWQRMSFHSIFLLLARLFRTKCGAKGRMEGESNINISRRNIIRAYLPNSHVEWRLSSFMPIRRTIPIDHDYRCAYYQLTQTHTCTRTWENNAPDPAQIKSASNNPHGLFYGS